MLTILSAYSHRTAPTELGTLIILLTLGMCFMLSSDSPAFLSLCGILVVLIIMLHRQKSRSRFSKLWGVGLYGLALGCLATSLVSSPPIRSVLLLFVYLILLPTFPFHAASIVSFSRMNGMLTNFLSLFLPALGLKGFLMIRGELPAELMGILSVFALIGALYGGIRALVQNNLRHRLAYAGLAFWSVLWWYLANTEVESAPVILYFCAISLSMQGLLISTYLLEQRHGNLNLDQLGGLARVMPRFGVLLSLLVAAAMGLPLFGSFTALLAMSTSAGLIVSPSFVFVLITWFLASWHFPLFMQHILLGPPKPGRNYRDLALSETLSLTLIVLIVAILGIAPTALLRTDITPKQEASIRETNSRLR
jgi:NADH:ubiquinone oxidoreductase subunit 4 (subunit M)